MYQVHANTNMEKYLEDRLEWILEKNKGKMEVANIFFIDRLSNFDDLRV